MIKSAIDIICDEAEREGREQIEAKRGKRKNVNQKIPVKKCARLDSEPLFLSQLKTEKVDPNVITTNGFFSITYVNQKDKRYKKNKPYIFGQDIIRARFTFATWGHFERVANLIPELKWIMKWCTPKITPKLFGLAKTHCGSTFIITVDWEAYAEHLRKRIIEELGHVPDKEKEREAWEAWETPFLGHDARTDHITQVKTQELVMNRKDKNYYLEEIAKIDAEYIGKADSNEDN